MDPDFERMLEERIRERDWTAVEGLLARVGLDQAARDRVLKDLRKREEIRGIDRMEHRFLVACLIVLGLLGAWAYFYL